MKFGKVGSNFKKEKFFLFLFLCIRQHWSLIFVLFLFTEKHQAEFQLDYIQLSPEIIGESVRHVPFQKKKEKKSRKNNRLRNESLYRHQREFHSFPVDKFSSTWFISYKNDDDTVTCVYVCVQVQIVSNHS